MPEDAPKRCFVICPIGDEESAVRKRADQLLRHVFRPTLAELGFETLRADMLPRPGLITTQIIQRIVECPLVIADLTGANPNVFYELAVRHATRKPYVHVIQKGDRIPFDIAGVRTISIDHTNLDDVEHARAEIKNQILSFSEGHQADSPLSTALDVIALKRDDTSIERLLTNLRAVEEKVESLKLGIAIEMDEILEKTADKIREHIDTTNEDLVSHLPGDSEDWPTFDYPDDIQANMSDALDTTIVKIENILETKFSEQKDSPFLRKYVEELKAYIHSRLLVSEKRMANNCAAPNGGPSTQLGYSGVMHGPPSVS